MGAQVSDGKLTKTKCLSIFLFYFCVAVWAHWTQHSAPVPGLRLGNVPLLSAPTPGSNGAGWQRPSACASHASIRGVTRIRSAGYGQTQSAAPQPRTAVQAAVRATETRGLGFGCYLADAREEQPATSAVPWLFLTVPDCS